MDIENLITQIVACRARSEQATAKAAEAFGRLLELAEKGTSGQARYVARFIAATFDSQEDRYDPFDLRAVDVAISDDMLTCLDALRWARADLHTLVADGEARARAVIARWGGSSIDGPAH